MIKMKGNDQSFKRLDLVYFVKFKLNCFFMTNSNLPLTNIAGY